MIEAQTPPPTEMKMMRIMKAEKKISRSQEIELVALNGTMVKIIEMRKVEGRWKINDIIFVKSIQPEQSSDRQ